MNRWDEVITYADFCALCRDTNTEEDEPTAKECLARLRELQTVEAHPTNRKRLWQNARRMIDDALFSGVLLLFLSYAGRVGWLIGCTIVGGDPTL